MDLVEVELTSMAITARYGALQSGTILRTDKDYAQHLVEDCGAAKYVTAQVTKPQQTPVVTTPAAPRKKADTKAATNQANPDVAAQDSAAPGAGDPAAATP